MTESSYMPAEIWAAKDLQEAATAARTSLCRAIELIHYARRNRRSDDSYKELVDLVKTLVTVCCKARDKIRPVSEELIAIRRGLKTSLPRLDNVFDAFAVGLAASFAWRVVDGCCLRLPDINPDARRMCLNATDTRSLETIRRQLKAIEVPNIGKLYELIAEELSAATLRRSRSPQPQVKLSDMTRNELEELLDCSPRTIALYADEASVPPRAAHGVPYTSGEVQRILEIGARKKSRVGKRCQDILERGDAKL